MSIAIPLSIAISIDKIRNLLYVLLLTESIPARRRPDPGRAQRLFENLPDHNPSREPGSRRAFAYFFGRNPLKRLDSKK
jgi:hypothetical protein